uniref:Uncharacterized protein n=1 Tax=Anguilla anguilla TaxID=7936 RepID=A0A0E9RGS7_ANGAN
MKVTPELSWAYYITFISLSQLARSFYMKGQQTVRAVVFFFCFIQTWRK